MQPPAEIGEQALAAHEHLVAGIDREVERHGGRGRGGRRRACALAPDIELDHRGRQALRDLNIRRLDRDGAGEPGAGVDVAGEAERAAEALGQDVARDRTRVMEGDPQIDRHRLREAERAGTVDRADSGLGRETVEPDGAASSGDRGVDRRQVEPAGNVLHPAAGKGERAGGAWRG